MLRKFLLDKWLDSIDNNLNDIELNIIISNKIYINKKELFYARKQ